MVVFLPVEVSLVLRLVYPAVGENGAEDEAHDEPADDLENGHDCSSSTAASAASTSFIVALLMR